MLIKWLQHCRSTWRLAAQKDVLMRQTSSPDQKTSTPAERRTAPRCRVLKTGKMITLDKQSIFDCTIRNQSPSGAWLLFPSLIGIPDKFFFLAPSKPNLVQCEVVRRTAAGCGVRFVSEGGQDARAQQGDAAEQLADRIASALDALDRDDTEAARRVLLGDLRCGPGPTMN